MTFDMYGVESINCDKHDHNDKDECHRCNSKNTEIQSDCVTGMMWWVYLKCNDCGLGMIFHGGAEDWDLNF